MIVGLGKLKFNFVLKNCGYSLVTTWSELISLGVNFKLIAKNPIGDRPNHPWVYHIGSNQMNSKGTAMF